MQGYTLTPSQEAQAIAYARARHDLYFLDVAYGLLLLVLLLQLRVAPVFRDLALRASDNRFAQTAVFGPLILLTIDVFEPAHRNVESPSRLEISTINPGMGIVAGRLGQKRNGGGSDRRSGDLDFICRDSREPAKVVVLFLVGCRAVDHFGCRDRAAGP